MVSDDLLVGVGVGELRDLQGVGQVQRDAGQLGETSGEDLYRLDDVFRGGWKGGEFGHAVLVEAEQSVEPYGDYLDEDR